MAYCKNAHFNHAEPHSFDTERSAVLLVKLKIIDTSCQTFVRFSVHLSLDNIAVTMAINFLSGLCFAYLSCCSIRLTILDTPY
jgi:hypothetical protein